MKRLFQTTPLLLKREWQIRYPNRWAALGEVFSLFLSLSIYYFTAKALGEAIQPKLKGLAPDYFTFIVMAEIILLLPSVLVTAYVTSIRQLYSEGTLEPLFLLPMGAQKVILLFGSISVLREAPRMLLTLGVACFAFQMDLSFAKLPLLFGLLLISLPAFATLGLLGSALFLKTGRGTGILNTFTAVSTVAAGAYFPTSVFPQSFSSTLLLLSPFSALLDLTRTFSSNGITDHLIQPALTLAGWGILGLPLALWTLKRTLNGTRIQGRVEILIT